ncbi:MAG TPA: hypothetical protein VFN65_02550 [Solirubrobacteraceae bacterium]|nr:hypothetical protein [Solirubrobacteraceae bacterium]
MRGADRHRRGEVTTRATCSAMPSIHQLIEAVNPVDYRVFAGVIEPHQWPRASRLIDHALGGRLGDNRNWKAIESWADSVARTLAGAHSTRLPLGRWEHAPMEQQHDDPPRGSRRVSRSATDRGGGRLP